MANFNTIEIKFKAPNHAELRTIRLREKDQDRYISWGLHDSYMLDNNSHTMFYRLRQVTINGTTGSLTDLGQRFAEACLNGKLFIDVVDLDTGRLLDKIHVKEIIIYDEYSGKHRISAADDYKAKPVAIPEYYVHGSLGCMIFTPERRMVICQNKRNMNEQALLNLFHKILEDHHIQEPHTITAILQMPKDTLKEYGLEFEECECERFIDFSKSRLLPYAKP